MARASDPPFTKSAACQTAIRCRIRGFFVDDRAGFGNSHGSEKYPQKNRAQVTAVFSDFQYWRARLTVIRNQTTEKQVFWLSFSRRAPSPLRSGTVHGKHDYSGGNRAGFSPDFPILPAGAGHFPSLRLCFQYSPSRRGRQAESAFGCRPKLL